jgi:Bifunctional DNA primase/polymerase, N-terminal
VHALEALAAGRGWRVLPCHHITSSGRCSCGRRDCTSPGKHPRTRHGLAEASNDRAVVAGWARRWQSANVGVATGAGSDVVVVDLDGPAALAWWAAAQLEHGYEVVTLAQTTPGHGGGLHLFFGYPTDGRVIRNSAGRLAEHVDVRGEGGYVIVAPSNHVDGVYEWVDVDTPIASLPEWLAALMVDTPAPPPPPPPRQQRTRPPVRNERAMRSWAAAALVSELDTLAAATVGGRNDALNTAAYNLGQIVAGGELTATTVRAALGAIARDLGLGEHEIEATITSGMNSGAGSPRSTPEPPTRPPTPGDVNGHGGDGRARRTIIVNDRALENVSDDVAAAIEETNTPPRVFVRGGRLVRVRLDERDRPSIEPLTTVSLRWYAALAATYNVVRWSRDGDVHRVVFPPKDAVADLLERDRWQYPPLRAVSAAPVVRPDGTIHARHGYDEATGYFHWSPGDRVPPIPREPTPAELITAVEIVEEALCDFPFEENADRANAWGFLLTPLVRPLLGAVPPMALIDAPQPGTGKGMLVKLMSVIAFGSTQAMTPLPDREEEFAKLLTTFLLQGQPLVVLDNVDRPLRSPTLAACLTSDPYAGRVLGQSSAPPVPNAAVYCATGNNIAVGGDLGRRCYRIRLNYRGPNPDRRRGFTHDPLLAWASTYRYELLGALATLVRAWWVAGQPAAEVVPMGESTEWARIVGGVLAHAGVDGFLANLDELRQGGDIDDGEWAAFLAKWRAEFGPAQVTAADLTKRLELEPSFRVTLPSRLSGAWETKSWPTTLGSNLRSRQGRYHGESGFYVRRHYVDRLGRAIWSVGQYDDPDPDPLGEDDPTPRDPTDL